MSSRKILRRNRLRPPHQGRPSRIGQLIDAASGPREPAIDIVLQYLGCVGDGGPQISRRLRTIPEQGGTGERLLAIGGHDRRSCAAAGNRIAEAALVFAHEPAALLQVAARPPGAGFYQQLDVPGGGDADEAEAEQPQSLRTRGSRSRPERRNVVRTASQISSHAALRSTPWRTSSRLKLSFSSQITTMPSARRPTTSQPQTSPFTANPSFSR